MTAAAEQKPRRITIACRCGAKVRVQEAGRAVQGRCPKCGAMIEATAADFVFGSILRMPVKYLMCYLGVMGTLALQFVAIRWFVRGLSGAWFCLAPLVVNVMIAYFTCAAMRISSAR